MAAIVLIGAGKMGTAILDLARTSEHDVVAVVDPGKPPVDAAVFADLPAALRTAPGAVVLDFSSAAGAGARIRMVGERGHSLVQGTTGLDEAARAALADISRSVAVVEAPNTSPGIALLREALVALLGRLPAWDVSITDRHHREKRDAPSGTARLLARAIAETTGREPEVASYRQGGVVGEHTVILAGSEEELILTHRALSRTVFARGALLAAAFCVQAPPGHYTMPDVLRGP